MGFFTGRMSNNTEYLLIRPCYLPLNPYIVQFFTGGSAGSPRMLPKPVEIHGIRVYEYINTIKIPAFQYTRQHREEDYALCPT